MVVEFSNGLVELKNDIFYVFVFDVLIIISNNDVFVLEIVLEFMFEEFVMIVVLVFEDEVDIIIEKGFE